MDKRAFVSLISYLGRIPSISGPIGSGVFDDGNWWVKFAIDISHPTAWQTVQEISFVLNYVSLDERLPTRFIPVSPPPYLNGGPKDFLSWVIESTTPEFRPRTCMKWLESRLPSPVDDLSQWEENDE